MIAVVIIAIIITPGLLILIGALLRKRHYPEKSLKNCAINVALTPLRFLRLQQFKHGTITLEKSMKYALRKTKLDDFGSTDFVTNYASVVDTAEHKKLQLTNIGYMTYRLEMNMTMVRRLKFLQYLKDVPAVTQTPVRSPVFVLGLPRTGTTFLHRLLSLDPNVRSPLMWELLAPVPMSAKNGFDDEMKADLDKRRKYVHKLIAFRKTLGDNALQHIHEIGADLPEECILALTDELPIHMSLLYSCYVNWESFFAIPSQCVSNAYSYYKKVLQLLSWQTGETEDPRRWVLKCPIHLYYIKEIARVFPDAKLVWTHRHPVSAVPSLCSLVKSLFQLYYENESRDDALLGKRVSELSSKYLVQAVEDIRQSNLSCSHIHYEDLVKDPISVVKQVYAQNEWTFSSEYQAVLERYLRENQEQREQTKLRRARGGDVLHHYAPEEFSLTAEELSSGNFAAYCKMFDVPMSKN